MTRQFIGSVTLLVRDYDEAISWYCEVLGFSLLEDALMPDGKRWVDEYARMMDELLERHGPDATRIDSFHGGLHPTAECTPGPLGLIGNASTDMMHFHLGPTGEHMQTQWGRVILELDGESIIDDGHYVADWDDPKLRETASRFGLTSWK